LISEAPGFRDVGDSLSSVIYSSFYTQRAVLKSFKASFGVKSKDGTGDCAEYKDYENEIKDG
jgi:hypothetical protein